MNLDWITEEELADDTEAPKQVCLSCGEEISSHNTLTKAGVAEFYISGICEKCYDDCTYNLDENLDILDQDILSLIKDGVILAGGALRALVDTADDISDYDLFVLSQSKVEPLKQSLVELGYKNIFQCPEGKLFTYTNEEGTKVQIINKRDYTSCNDIIFSFDITACCCAYDGEQFYQHQRFVFDNLNKRININTVEFPNATLRRIIKYTQKGFKLSRQGCNDYVNMVNTMQIDEGNAVFYID